MEKFKISKEIIDYYSLTKEEIKMIYYINKSFYNKRIYKSNIDNLWYLWLRSNDIIKEISNPKISKEEYLQIVKNLKQKNILLELHENSKRKQYKIKVFALNYKKFFGTINQQKAIDTIEKIFILKECPLEISFLEFCVEIRNLVYEFLLNPNEKMTIEIAKLLEDIIDFIREITKDEVKHYIKQIGYENYLKTPLWKYNRKITMFNKEKECIMCSSKEKIEVHHLTYKNIGFEKDNELCYLCNDCHNKVHNGEIDKTKLFERVKECQAK